MGNATPDALGAIRVIVCGTLLLSALWEDPASLAFVPIELRKPMGVLELFYTLPIGFEAMVTSVTGLTIFQWATRAFLLLATLGAFTRVTLPLAALCYAVLGGLMRQYAWFYHTGLIPLYICIALSFLPCADGLSIDAWRRSRAGLFVPDPRRATSEYGWARYVCWILLAVPYVLAGLSKLREGFDPPWWTPLNFERIVLGTNLRPMHFDFDGGLLLVRAGTPHWVFELLGFSAVVSEAVMFAVLFSRTARLILPPVMVLLHVGILLMQNILFFDLILLQLIFVDWDRVLTRVGRPFSVSSEGHSAVLERRYGVATLALPVFLLGWWTTDHEYYPFTAMQMFTGRVSTSGVIRYQTIAALDESGRREDIRIERIIPALADTRYRQFINAGESRRPRTQRFLDAVAKKWNEQAPQGKRIVAFEIEARAWNFKDDPGDPELGRTEKTFTYRIGAQGDVSSASAPR